MKDKVIGACLGTAIGDALGMPAECKKPETIRRLYGTIKSYRTPKSAKDGKPFHHNLSAGMWTDDTQLMLAVGESIVDRGGIDYDDIAQRHILAYQEKRGWGKSTKQAVQNMMGGETWYNAGIDGAVGTGPPMKIAPIGVLYGMEIINDFNLMGVIHNISIMTHKDPMSFVAAFAQARLIGAAIRGDEWCLRDTMWAVRDLCLVIGRSELSHKIDDAYIMGRDGKEDNQIREKLGCSPYVLEAYPFTYAMLSKYWREPRKCLEVIVNSGGDADTTGAMAGAVLGAIHGYKAFPLSWRLRLKERQRIINMARGLYELGENNV